VLAYINEDAVIEEQAEGTSLIGDEQWIRQPVAESRAGAGAEAGGWVGVDGGGDALSSGCRRPAAEPASGSTARR